MVAAGPSASVLVIVTTVWTWKPMEGAMDSGIVFTRGYGPVSHVCHRPGHQRLSDGALCGSIKCLGAHGGHGDGCGVLDVCLEGLCVPMGLLAFAVVAAAV